MMKFPHSREVSMGKINFARVIVGGIISGLIINTGEFLLNEVFFVRQMEEMLRRLNTPRPGFNFIATATVLTFVLGIVIVLTYAMIRPRFGAGPKTAILSALVAWFYIYVYAGILNSVLFGVPINLLVIGIAWGAVEYILAGLAGAWFYKEK
jgi:hypothetical protein